MDGLDVQRPRRGQYEATGTLPRRGTRADGNRDVEPEISKSALLIVDMQNDHPEGWFAHRSPPEGAIDVPFLMSTIPRSGASPTPSAQHVDLLSSSQPHADQIIPTRRSRFDVPDSMRRCRTHI